MGIMFFPWQVICIAHPFGHEHHRHNGPSPCELHRLAAQQGGQHILPPMECGHFSLHLADYQPPQVEKASKGIYTFITLALILNLIDVGHRKQPFFITPEPTCRSAPLISSFSLRGPPFI